MKGLNKTVILPILAVINLLLQAVFGIEIPQETLNEVASAIINVASVGVVVYGIFKNHNKEEQPQETEEA